MSRILCFIYIVVSALYNAGAQPAQDGYIGSESCIVCHANLHKEIVDAWRISAHHLSMRPASVLTVQEDSLSRTLSSSGINILGVIGSFDGRWTSVTNDFHVLAPALWRAEESYSPHDSIGKSDSPLDASVLCLGCHTTAWYAGEKVHAECGIGCESCHGPGVKHRESDGSRETILNPSTLDPDRQRMVCGQCHSLGKDISGIYPFPVKADGKTIKPFFPGDDLSKLFVDAKPVLPKPGWEYSLLVQSSERYSRLLCTECHDPHGRLDHPAMLRDTSNEICLKCHGIGSMRLSFENHWGLGNVLEWPCWDCHHNAHSH